MNTEEIKKELRELLHEIESCRMDIVGGNLLNVDFAKQTVNNILQSLESEETKCKNCNDKGCNYCYDYDTIDQ